MNLRADIHEVKLAKILTHKPYNTVALRMAQGMHADITTILASNRLDR